MRRRRRRRGSDEHWCAPEQFAISSCQAVVAVEWKHSTGSGPARTPRPRFEGLEFRV